jgi:hypothetical protein
MLQRTHVDTTELGNGERIEQYDADKWHRDALDVVDNALRIRNIYAGDFLNVISAGTNDPLLKIKCLDVVHFLDPRSSEEVSPNAVLALTRLRDYCNDVLNRSATDEYCP